jgi:hypothetical protein
MRFQYTLLPWIKQLAKVPTLKKIIVECDYPRQATGSDLSRGINADPTLKALFEFKK